MKFASLLALALGPSLGWTRWQSETARQLKSTPIQGTTEKCLDGKIHSLSYTANVMDSVLVDLDGDLGSLLESVTCDIDHTQLLLQFRHNTDAIEYLVKFHDWNDHFIVGGTSWNCSVIASAERPTYILRRVVGASENTSNMSQLTISTAMARYDEVFEDADIGYGISGECNEAAEAPVCLGYNTKCDGQPAEEIPLYSTTTKSGAALDASCSDCWAALSTDAFVNISIRNFKLESLSAGFENVQLNVSMVVDTKATERWNAAVDKTLALVSTQYLLDFKVGSVPFMLYFDVPMEVKASLSFDGAADLKFGAQASIALGDAVVRWDPSSHWTHSEMKPVYAFAPSLTSSSSAEVTSQLSLLPTFNLHFDRVFSYSLKASSTLNPDITTDTTTKQVCETSTYDLELESSSELDMNINVVDFHKDWTWGPNTVGSWKGSVVPQKCVKL